MALSPETLDRFKRLDHLESMARWLDDGIPVPGTRFRFGMDAIFDIVPFAGDFVGIGFSGWILVQAARLGASKATLLRMLYNIAIDALAGAIPGIGVFFDAAWKANRRNVDLLQRQFHQPMTTAAASRRFAWALGAGLVVIFGAGIVLTVLALKAASALLRHSF